ncbi:MAG TPA: hypothetical protein VH309_09020, partial [Elusimicrobiota bacterium]|nr:hypothetical protein [Elusimicrobiota bacterium]
MKSTAASLWLLLAAGIPREAGASDLQNAQQYCSEVNAHWVGGQQQCACNAGYVQSDNTCVAAAAPGAAAGIQPNAAGGGTLRGAAATLVGGALGGLLAAPTGYKPYVHTAPTPAVQGDDDLAPDPALDSGVGDAQDIISGYHPPELSDGDAVSGAGVQRWMTEPIPLLTGNIADIEAFLQGPAALENFTAAARNLVDATVSLGRGVAVRLSDAASTPGDQKAGGDAGPASSRHAIGYDGLSEAYEKAQGSDGTP